MSITLPLIEKEPNSPIAWLSNPINQWGVEKGLVSVKEFITHINAVASVIGQADHIINLCENRYLFLVTFCAAIASGKTNLLPPNKNIKTQQDLSNQYSNCFIVHDSVSIDDSIKNIDLREFKLSGDQSSKNVNFEIPSDHVACICFTSGSTGSSQAITKTWKTFYESTQVNYRYMIPKTQQTLYLLATMPAQHMWGLETSILMPLLKNICISDQKPLYPRDIMDTLVSLPNPTVLVSTPIHLRALVASQNNAKHLHTVLCATSPFTVNLARQVEALFSTQVGEVYGCSEAGSMAIRQTASEDSYLRFDAFKFDHQDNTTTVSADHLQQSFQLQDHIKQIGEERFSLAGRASDMIKIAGKRGSLFEINKLLLSFEGLQDGIVINPESELEVSRLCAIVALKEDSDKATLLKFLRENLDSAFVPRPIYLVDRLPREANGKLVKSKINSLLQRLRDIDH